MRRLTILAAASSGNLCYDIIVNGEPVASDCADLPI